MTTRIRRDKSNGFIARPSPLAARRLGQTVISDKPDRLQKLVEEMERQLQRPLTSEERHCLSLYLDASSGDQQSEAAGNSSQ